jgi:predicted DNA-binding transcriptional regulator AlpA
MSERLLTFPDLALKGIPYVRQHLARMEEKGQFPKRRQLGPNRVVWLESEIDEHLRNLPRGTLPLTRGR